MAAPVHLGVAGELIGPSEVRRHVHSVAGGSPAFPGAGPPLHASSASAAAAADLATLPPPCPTCSAPTALVLQAHAPLPGAPDRALYVFSCVSSGGSGEGGGGGGCAEREGGWVALRAGVGRSTAGEGAASLVAEPTAAPAAPAPAPPPPASVFGGGGGGWSDDDGNDEGGGGASDGTKPFDLIALSAELAAAGEALAAAQATGKRRPPFKEAPEPGDAPATPSWSPPPSTSTPTLPAFWVGWAPEPAGPAKASAAEDAHIAALLAAYKAEEGGEDGGEEAVPDDGDDEGGCGSCTPAAPGPSSSSSKKTTATDVSWAGEAYEPDAAPGADAAYLRFAKRLGRRPDQVARYYDGTAGGGGGSGSGVVWPVEGGPPPAPPCPLCGGARALELQLVPPLTAMFDEAAAWEGTGAGDDDGGGAPGAWRWATVGVWACGAAGCGRPGGAASGWVAREVVGVVDE